MCQHLRSTKAVSFITKLDPGQEFINFGSFYREIRCISGSLFRDSTAVLAKSLLNKEALFEADETE